MISSGIFILPGLAFAKAGPAVILSYILAALICIPTLFSQAELTTAMPKAGGDYFYIMRGFGPLLGTVAGFSSWFALSFKGAFALLGMGAFLSMFSPLPLHIVALILCVFFVIINLLGVKFAGKFQVYLVIWLLAILVIYIIFGVQRVNVSNFNPFFAKGYASVFATASFVFISYGGLTKVASLAEEVHDPGRNLPLGMFLSLAVTTIIYALAVFVTIGIMNPEILKSTLTPISDASAILGGSVFKILVSVAAFFAFISTANAAIMSASRYPLSMSRDKILPELFQKVHRRFNTPHVSIILTGVFMITVIAFLRLESLVKVASSILIILYILANFSVILFRESRIQSYRPKFISPMYPVIQITGILAGLFLLIEMGSFIIFLTLIILGLEIFWYGVYSKKHTSRDSALIYLLERLVAQDKGLVSDNLLTELKDIVIKRDDIIEDKIHKVIDNSIVLDINDPLLMESFFAFVSHKLSVQLNINENILNDKFLEREKASSTLLAPRLAIPHIIVEGENIFQLVIVRSAPGVIFPEDKLAHMVFVIVASDDLRNLHLKMLAAIAQITQNKDFDQNWMSAKNIDELRNLVLLAERKRSH